MPQILHWGNRAGRQLNVRLSEHKNDVKNCKPYSGIATHSNGTGHSFDFKNTKILLSCKDIAKRHVIESSLLKLNEKQKPY